MITEALIRENKFINIKWFGLLLVLLLPTKAYSLKAIEWFPIATELSVGVHLPSDKDYGLLCYVEYVHTIIGSTLVIKDSFSQDAGLTWQQGSMGGGIYGNDCSLKKKITTELWVPPGGQVSYHFYLGESVEISTD